MCGVVSKITILLMLSKLLENDALKKENRGVDGTLFEPAAGGFNTETAKGENEKRYFPRCLRGIFRRKISTSEPVSEDVRLERVKEMIRNDWCSDLSLQATIEGKNKANQRCRDAVAALISLPDSYKTYRCQVVTQGNCRPQPGGYRCTVHPLAWELLFREHVFYKHVKRNYIFQLSQCIKPTMLNHWVPRWKTLAKAPQGGQIQMSPEEMQQHKLQLVKEMVLDDQCNHLSVSWRRWRRTRKSENSCILAARALIDLDSSFRTEDCEWITSGGCRPSSEGYRCTVLPYHSSCLLWNYTIRKQLKPGYVFQLKHCIHPDRLSTWLNGGETKYLTRKYVNEQLELSKQRQTDALTSSLTSRDISIHDD